MQHLHATISKKKILSIAQTLGVGIILFLAPQLLVGLGAGFFAVFAAGVSANEVSDWLSGSNAMIVITILSELVAVGLFWILIIKHSKFDVQLKLKSLRRIILSAVKGFLLYLLLTTVALTMVNVSIKGVDLGEDQNIGITNPTGVWLVLTGIALVLLVPIAEELLFRGYLYHRFKKAVSIPVSVIATSVLFGLAHGQWNVGIDTFCASLGMIYALEDSDSLWASILVHATKNGIAFIVLFTAA